MSDSVSYGDIIILALIAGFILLRLRSVLGQKMGNEDMDFFRRDEAQLKDRSEPVVHVETLKPKIKEEPDSYLAGVTDVALKETLEKMRERDPLFTATTFLAGARLAFEMVFDAFAKGDRTTLKMLLTDSIYQEFETELARREKEPSRNETTLVSVQAKEISNAALDKNIATLTVKFVSQQVTVGRDADGKIVEGDASELHEVDDEWVFERDVMSKNPNWKIIDT